MPDVKNLPTLAVLFLRLLCLAQRHPPPSSNSRRIVVVFLTQEHEVRLVDSQGQHDEIGIVAVDTVPQVRKVPAVGKEIRRRRNSRSRSRFRKQKSKRTRTRRREGGGERGGADEDWDVKGHPGWLLALRMYSMILCSPSPGTSWPEMMTVGTRQTASVEI